MPHCSLGDLSGYDADSNYALKPLDDLLPAHALAATMDAAPASAVEYTYREAVQKPTTPAYRAYLEARGGARKLILDESRAAAATSDIAGGADLVEVTTGTPVPAEVSKY